MKKKIVYIMSLGVMVFFLTGCVRFNANLDIKKNKSMDFSIVYAFDTTYFGDEELLSTEDKRNMEEKGFQIDNYTDNNMKGFTISKNIKNIDKISDTNDVEYNLSGIMNESTEANVFKIKKGLFKNTYIARLKFDATDSGLNNNASSDFDMDQNDDLDYNFDIISDGSNNDFSDFSNSLASNMDLSFNVKLPYSAKSNNATSTSNDNKELKWILSSTDVETIDFEFELYNRLNIGILITLVVGLIILVVVLITRKRGPKNGTSELESVNIPQSVNPEQMNMSPVSPVNNDTINSVPPTNVVPNQDSSMHLQNGTGMENQNTAMLVEQPAPIEILEPVSQMQPNPQVVVQNPTVNIPNPHDIIETSSNVNQNISSPQVPSSISATEESTPVTNQNLNNNVNQELTKSVITSNTESNASLNSTSGVAPSDTQNPNLDANDSEPKEFNPFDGLM